MSRYPMTDPITIPPFPLEMKKKSLIEDFFFISIDKVQVLRN